MYGAHSTTWTVPNGQTREWRADLVSLDQNATNAAVLIAGSGSGLYAVMKSCDFVFVLKWPASGANVCILACERAATRNTNVVLTLALTRVQPNLVVTTRVLDKANLNNVLYQCAVVDTPNVDPTINAAQFRALTGMTWQDMVDTELAGAPFTSFMAALGVFQYTDGTMPAVLGTFDNFELWTSLIPATYYVNVNNSNPLFPYTSWATAATNIQDAVDTAKAGDTVLVTNGVYATGGRVDESSYTENRVVITNSIRLESVNGPLVTMVQGSDSMRCVYLGTNAVLNGFTLTNGHVFYYGGGVFCEPSALVTNCVLTGNSAGLASTGGAGACGGTLWSCVITHNEAPYLGGSSHGGGVLGSILYNCTVTDNWAGIGGGAAQSTLYNCTLNGNSASWSGGGSAGGTLYNCTVSGNSATYGGGAERGTLYNCALNGNSATGGGGVIGGTLHNCTLTGNSADEGGGAFGGTLYNCIVYYNTAATNGANYSTGTNGWGQESSIALQYSCTTPLPTDGIGNIDADPLFVDYAHGNLHLQSNSPCINAGNNAYVTSGSDLDGNPRLASGTVDIGAYEYQGPGSVISYAWLHQYGLPTDGSADFTDPDHDGMNNWQEWRCGTCPTSASSALRLLSPQRTGTNVTVTWQSVAGVSYLLECCTSLSPSPLFTPLATGIPGQPGTTTYTDTTATNASPYFYRVGVGN